MQGHLDSIICISPFTQNQHLISSTRTCTTTFGFHLCHEPIHTAYASELWHKNLHKDNYLHKTCTKTINFSTDKSPFTQLKTDHSVCKFDQYTLQWRVQMGQNASSGSILVTASVTNLAHEPSSGLQALLVRKWQHWMDSLRTMVALHQKLPTSGLLNVILRTGNVRGLKCTEHVCDEGWCNK